MRQALDGTSLVDAFRAGDPRGYEELRRVLEASARRRGVTSGVRLDDIVDDAVGRLWVEVGELVDDPQLLRRGDDHVRNLLRHDAERREQAVSTRLLDAIPGRADSAEEAVERQDAMDWVASHLAQSEQRLFRLLVEVRAHPRRICRELGITRACLRQRRLRLRARVRAVAGTHR